MTQQVDFRVREYQLIFSSLVRLEEQVVNFWKDYKANTSKSLFVCLFVCFSFFFFFYWFFHHVLISNPRP